MISFIFFVIALIILFVSTKNLNKAFILFLCFRLFVNYTIGLSFIPGLPNLQLEMLMCLFFIFKYGSRHKRMLRANPLYQAIHFLVISMAISSLLTEGELGTDLMRTFNTLVKGYVFVYPTWLFACSLQRKDINFLAWSFSISSIIIIAYSAFCLKIGMNPLVDYEIALTGGDLSESGYMNENSERGVRWSSVFLHPIGCGVNCVYLFAVSIFCYYYSTIKSKYKTILFVGLTLGLLFVMMQSKSRTPIIGFAILMMPLVLQLKNKSLIIGVFVAMAVFVNFLDDISMSLIRSITENNSDEVGGSSMEMRINQGLGVLHFWLQHPLFGYGLVGYGSLLTQHSKYDLFGVESVWLYTPLAFGIVGIYAIARLYWRMIKIKVKQHQLDVWAMVGSYILMNSVSTIPDQKEFLPFLVVFLYMRVNSSDTLVQRTTR